MGISTGMGMGMEEMMSIDESFRDTDPTELPSMSMEDLVNLNILFGIDVNTVTSEFSKRGSEHFLRDPSFLLMMCTVLVKAYVTQSELMRRVMHTACAYTKPKMDGNESSERQ